MLWDKMKSGKMATSVVDSKWRIAIPKALREELEIAPRAKVTFEIKKVEPRLSFTKEAVGLIKGKKIDVVDYLHKYSPYRGRPQK